MSTAATIEAINAVSALTTVLLRSTEALQRVGAIVQQAQTEGRDLTQAEIDEVRGLRGKAMERWDEMGPLNAGGTD